MSMNGADVKWKSIMSMNGVEVKKSESGGGHIWHACHSEAILAAHMVIVIIVVDRPAIRL